MHYLLLLFIFFISFPAAGQNTVSFNKLPLRNGTSEEPVRLHGCYMDVVIVHSKNDSCFSTVDGVIISVFDLGGEFVAVIKTTDKRFYIYSHLDRLSVAKNDTVQKGQFLGSIAGEAGEFELIFMISDNTGRTLSYQKHLLHLQTVNKEFECTEQAL